MSINIAKSPKLSPGDFRVCFTKIIGYVTSQLHITSLGITLFLRILYPRRGEKSIKLSWLEHRTQFLKFIPEKKIQSYARSKKENRWWRFAKTKYSQCQSCGETHLASPRASHYKNQNMQQLVSKLPVVIYFIFCIASLFAIFRRAVCPAEPVIPRTFVL